MGESVQLFEELAERYDAWYDSPIGRVAFPLEVAVLRPLLSGSPKPWIEIGVGSGRFAKELQVDVGIDPAMKPLLLAKKRSVTVVQAVGEKLPFRDASFGAVLIVVTLCFVNDPISVLREAKRVLRDDGALVLGMVFADSPWGEFYKRKASEGHPFYKAAHFLSRGDLKQMLDFVGFSVVAARSTLRQSPSDFSLHPEPVLDGDLPDAGFVGWKAVPQ
ncbi:class I SAM-dependent methyltransferase [Fervidibacter sacchari]|uniref:Ubiquinone/menaquinone biosynthesis C-methylase UbiE n=1 Tax=Candidatus Fervidibacter sacchari TaxID=1448929 RepID=A0ABT2EV35_9BACT|nr:class I SAM-dependent methyltransferase [Candidatus Fervidibacter sacchari]MCS3920788.1 ubiquinone/menaquinone biosynthesis C-methylase UbiE [Candidatus Fervidibacter sacchari]WKU17875.1 class I SAM-dependent methyltransferase [Candidatus Fervidibacter sacchari]